MSIQKITMTDLALAALLRMAYEDGWDDSTTVIVEDHGPRTPNEEDWEHSVTFSNMQDDLAKAKQNGGRMP